MIRRLAPIWLILTMGLPSAQLCPAFAADGVEFDSPAAEQLKPSPDSGFTSEKKTVSPEPSAAAPTKSPSTGWDQDEKLPPDSLAPVKDESLLPLRESSSPDKVSDTGAAADAAAPELRTRHEAALPPKNKKQAGRKSASRGYGLGMVSHVGKAVIDAPGAIYRKSVSEFHAGVRDMTNNSSSPMVVVPATILSLPFSAVAGCVEGTLEAFRGGDATDAKPEVARKKSAIVAGKAPAKVAGRSQLTP